MEQNEQNTDMPILWGITNKKTLSNKPKEQRILELVEHMIFNIRNDEKRKEYN